MIEYNAVINKITEYTAWLDEQTGYTCTVNVCFIGPNESATLVLEKRNQQGK